MGHVDIHCHVLPGIDDGAASLTEALAFAAAARRAGTSELVATPHMFQPGLGSDDPELVRAAFAALSAELERSPGEAAGPTLHLGAENYVGEALLAAATEGTVLTLGGGPALLAEFWPLTTASAAVRSLEALLALGYTPVLAHVERYAFLHEDASLLERLVAAGCVAQVNAGAVVGRHGLPIVQLVERWLRQGLIAVIASDGHNLTSRPPGLAEAAAAIASRHGEEVAALCLADNPRALLSGAPVTRPRPARSPWWRRRRR